jgi:type VI secretion system protein ImpA
MLQARGGPETDVSSFASLNSSSSTKPYYLFVLMLHFNELLEPISQASPAGIDVTFSTDVDAVNKARQFDDPSLDQGEWVTAIKEADWQFVYDKCAALLATQTKDLRVAGWLVEAATKRRQFEGMAAGFELLTQLCERYWDVLHPLIEEGDAERRIGNISWLLSRSVQLVKEVPLTQARDAAFSWTDFEAARARVNAATRTGEAVTEIPGQPNMATLDAAKRKSSKGFYEALINDAVHCQAMVADFESTVDKHLGAQGPSFGQLKDALATVLDTIERFGTDVGLKSPTTALATDGAGEAISSANESAAVAANGQINNRDQALERLRQVAEFFRRTEPHSPVAYLADKAATWGDLPLHTWLKTVVKDPTSLAFIEEMLGVKSTDTGS